MKINIVQLIPQNLTFYLSYDHLKITLSWQCLKSK
jgi:hypothetical protein